MRLQWRTWQDEQSAFSTQHSAHDPDCQAPAKNKFFTAEHAEVAEKSGLISLAPASSFMG
jgi:hypothetical protein